MDEEGSGRLKQLLIALLLISCDATYRPPECDNTELLVGNVCRKICANQFHCWSNCCLPATVVDPSFVGSDGKSDWNVCEEAMLCYEASDGPSDAR